jgi:photosystem II stability/assembly factor-like uncharacterized protein
MKVSLPCLVLIILLGWIPADAQCGRWVTHGPFSGGVTSFQTSPLAPALVLADSPMGVARSLNGGLNWHTDFFPFGATVRVFPADPRRLILVSNLVYGSTDRGQHWHVIGGYGLPWNAQLGDIQFHSTDPKVLYAVACCGQGFAISVNGGKTWTPGNAPLGDWSWATLAVDPKNGDRIYLVMKGRVFRSDTRGSSWKDITGGIILGYENVVSIDPRNPQVIYIGYSQGIYKSTTGGNAWVNVNPHFYTTALAIDPRNTKSVYATGNQVIHSTDAGETWNPVSTPSGSYAAIAILPGRILLNGPNTGSIYKTPSGQEWKDASRGMRFRKTWDIRINPLRPDEMLAEGWGLSLARSTNGGNSWTILDWNNSPVFNPSNPDLLVGSGKFEGHSLSVSLDDGLTWNLRGPSGSSYEVKWDPQDANSFYFLHPNRERWWSVMKTTDLGHTWSAVGSDLFRGSDTFLLVGRNPSVLYAGSRNTSRKLLRSTDDGRSWKDLAAGLPKGYFAVIQVDPQNGNNMYVSLELPGGTTSTALYGSTDGGEHWALISGPGDAPLILNLVADPRDPQTLYAGWDGISVSHDGGRTWAPMNGGWAAVNGHIFDIAVSPQDPTRLFVATDTGVYRWTPYP